MVLNYSSSFRRYTPPTCTLEIYNPQPFWGKWRYQAFPQFFSFQLHFDDPRLTTGEKSLIIGDRTLLEKLRQLVDEYVNLYLDHRQIINEHQTCDLPQDNQAEFICLSRESDYSHKLYYQANVPQQETLEVILTNTQLFDLVNALEAYYYDVTKSSEEGRETNSGNLGLSILITALVCIIGGGLWWRYQENLTSQNNQENTPQLPQTETVVSNVEKVEPPTPLDPQTLPAITTPELPETLKNQVPLPPPDAIAPPPPQHNQQSTPQETTNIPTHNSQTALTIETLTVPTPSPASPLPSPPSPPSISSLPSSPSPPPISPLPSPPLPPPSSPTRLDKLPVLSASKLPETPINSLVNQESSPSSIASNRLPQKDDVIASVIQRNPTIPENITSLNPSNLTARKNPSTTAEKEIKQYFASKWQPPENLKQSIEYRLEVDSQGNLTRVTPIGQVAVIYLDRTNMPLLGEKIVSSSEEETPMTIRLILSPNGNVQTFKEN